VPNGGPCTSKLHDALKANPKRLRRHTTPAGVQCDDTGEALFEWRTCLRCGSSLAAPVEEGVPIHVEE
jgi:hypothetical protein